MKDVIEYLLKLLNDSDYIVTAISGGPDSMCLLDILIKVRKSKKVNIVVAHVNHNVRVAESEFEKVQVENYCKDNNLIFEYMKIEKYENTNFHDYARSVRYNFFNKLVKKYNAKYLMTAHHGDDLMETVLMRIVRGSSLSGYAGFNKESKLKDYKIIRPLITKTKLEIQNYMDSNNLWYAIDKSNSKDVYTRNRYRKYILPKLKDENENVHLKFLKFSEKISEVSNFLEKYTNKVYDELIKDKKINIKSLLKEDKIVIDNVLSKYLYSFYKNNIHLINDINIETIYNCMNNKKSSLSIDLPGNFRFIKSYNLGYIMSDENKTIYKYKLKDSINIKGYGTIKKLESSKETDNNILYLDSNDIALPLYVRCRKIGDKMHVKNMKELKKVKNIFIDCKIPIELRDTYPIVVDSNDNILWIPGLKKSQFDRKNSTKYDIILKYEQERMFL